MTPLEQTQFLNAIEALGQKQTLILVNAFSKKISGTRFSCGMDLLSETLGHVLDGSRTWRRDIPLGAFLHEAMRSVLSIDRKRGDKRPLSYEEWMEAAPDLGDPTPYGSSPEELLIYLEEKALAMAAIADARRRMASDEHAQILLGEALDMKAGEARKAFGIGERAYKAARDRIARDMRSRSEERRVGKECRSRWSPYH